MLSIFLSIAIAIASIFLPILHPNLVVYIFLNNLPTDEIIIFSISFFIFYKSFDTLRLILFRYVDQDSEYSYFPASRLLEKNSAYATLLLFSSFSCILFSIILAPIFILFLRIAWNYLKNFLALILIILVIILLVNERNKLGAIAIFLISGIIGLIILKAYPQMLSPLLIGFFSLPYLLKSVEINKIERGFDLNLFRLKFPKILKISFLASIASIPFALIPTITSTQLSILANRKRDDEKAFMNCCINASTPVFSLISLLAIKKARSGCLELIKELINPSPLLFIIAISCSLLSLIISTIFYSIFNKIPQSIYRKVLRIFLILFLILIPIFYGIISIIPAIIGFLVANISEKLKVRKVHCMGSLILPTILYYLSVRI